MKPLDILNIIKRTRSINVDEVSIAIKEMVAEKNSINISENFIVFNDIMRFCFGLSFMTCFRGKTVSVVGDEPDFHNLFATLSNEGLYTWAIWVADKGLKLYPLSSNLLSDYIESSTYFNRFSFSMKRKKCTNVLLKLPRNLWTWQAYTVYINFLISELMRNNKSEVLKKQIKILIDDFRENIPFDENSYFVEARFYDILDKKSQESRRVLEKAVAENVTFPTKCAYKLTMMYLDTAEYDKAIEILLKCKQNFGSFEETESIGSICFYLLLSRLGKYFFNKDKLSKEELEKLYADSLEDFRIVNKMNFNSNNAQSLYSRLENLATIFSAETGKPL